MPTDKKLLELALLDPSKVFKSPAELLAAEQFSREQKIEILHRWAYEQLELLVAEEENMQAVTNHDNSPLLDEILHALQVLGAKLPLNKPKTSKQGDV